jgi:hypothetical protein
MASSASRRCHAFSFFARFQKYRLRETQCLRFKLPVGEIIGQVLAAIIAAGALKAISVAWERYQRFRRTKRRRRRHG